MNRIQAFLGRNRFASQYSGRMQAETGTLLIDWVDYLIDEKQLNQFLSEGAIGSHLKNLQRKGGFKGFNQQSVSAIIQATDPRTQGHG